MQTRARVLVRALVRLSAATTLASLMAANAYTADIGSVRLLSGAGQPLRLVVAVTGLTAVDAATLAARVADPAAWQQNRLTPPVALEALRVTIEPGVHADARDLIISAAQAPAGEVIDMLLEVTSASGQRRVQVSTRLRQPAAQPGADLALPRVNTTVLVQRGNVLWHIARQHQYADVTLYQMLAALYQTNQPAFIRENMNWLHTGVTLVVPDAATVRAIDPLAARRLFLAHQEVFFRARAARTNALAMAAAQAVVMPPDVQPAEPPVAPPAAPPETLPAAEVSGDRLRLSGTALSAAAAAADQAGDEAVARQRADRYAAERVAQLQRTLSELMQALQPGVEANANADENVNPNAADAAAGEGQGEGEEGGNPTANRQPANGINANANATPTSAQPANPATQVGLPQADFPQSNATPARTPAADTLTLRDGVMTATAPHAASATVAIPAATTDPVTDAAWRVARLAANTPAASMTAPALPQDGAARPAFGALANPANVRAASPTAPAAPASAEVASAQAETVQTETVQADPTITDAPHAADTSASPVHASDVEVIQNAAAVTAPLSAAASTAMSQAATAENTTPPPPATDKAPPQRPSWIPPMPAPIAHTLSNPWLWAALGAALLAVIGWVARRNKQRRVNADDEVPSSADYAALREQFARRLKTIDLNLDDAPVNAARPENTGAQNTPPR